MSLDDLIFRADRLHEVIAIIEARLNERYRHSGSVEWVEPPEKSGPETRLALDYRRTGRTFSFFIRFNEHDVGFTSAPIRHRCAAVTKLCELVDVLEREQQDSTDLLEAATEEAYAVLVGLAGAGPELDR